MRHRILVVALMSLAVSGCQRAQPPTVFDEELNTQLAAIASISSQVPSAVIHEGLPHQATDPAFKTESQRIDAIEFAGYLFYQSKVEVSEADKSRLNAVLSDPQSYRRWLGEKLCDGFHPDWSIEWQIDGKHMTFLICFGCGEIKVAHPDGEWRFDMSRGTDMKLKAILYPYHTNLPKQSRNPY